MNNFQKLVVQNLNLKIKNVGLGTAQNIEYQLIFGNNKDIFKSSMFNEIIDKNQAIFGLNEDLIMDNVTTLTKEKIKEI